MRINEPAAPLLTLTGVAKSFSGVRALENVDFELRRGEIHALLGENGAGKSTLIKVLGGIHHPDAGAIHIDGQMARIRSVADAGRHGVRIIHQELSLAPNLSVAENIYLGCEPRRWGLLDRRRLERDAAALVRDLGWNELANVRAVVGRLTMAQRQLVEIARALSARARILVLDEPTSSLSEAETEALFRTLRQLREQGVGIIYISHRLEEVLRLADRVTVLRDGHSIGTQAAGAVSQRELVRWMVGRDIASHYPEPGRRLGEVALEVRDLRGARVNGVSFELRYGEILGLAGLVGAGRTELARALFGIDPIQSGEIRVDSRAVSIRSPRDALASGIVLVPEDRQQQGLVMMQTVGFNLALPWTREWITGPVLHNGKRAQIVDRAIRDFHIKTSGPEQRVANLSGGNQQKVTVGKWMEHRPRILVLDEPTHGVDVGAREEMFRIIHRLVESGMAVLLISSDLLEVLHLSHRVAIYQDGRILRTAPARELTSETVMAQLTGAKPE
jgi:ABC-type sugar transport system ATPase subunit